MDAYEWCPNENDVIEAVVNKLLVCGFTIKSTCTTNQHGIDIIANKNELELFIEAKGGTTSKDTARNGKPFTRNQVRTHISVALYSAMKLFTQYKDNENVIIGIALPFEKNHIDLINKIKYALEKMNIVVFWVNRDTVDIEVLSSAVEFFK